MINTVPSNSREGKTKRIVIVGPTPPPPGGVGTSILSVVAALSQEKGIEAIRLEWYEVWRSLSIRPHVIHFNFSKPVKRLFGSLIGRLLGATVVHTVHDNEFNLRHWANIGAMRISDGLIVLNEQVHKTLAGRTTAKVELMTPILRAGNQCEPGTLDAETSAIMDAQGAVKFAVVYAHAKDYRGAIETYGMFFVGNLLPQLKEHGIWVIFLDPKGEYETAELNPHRTDNAIHIKRRVNFRALLERAEMYLRPTSTDGNSVAVLEALEMGVPVIASDVVPRPAGVILYVHNDNDSFLNAVRSIEELRLRHRMDRSSLSSAEDYLSFVLRLREH